MDVGFTGTRLGMTDAQRATFGTMLVFDIKPTVFRHGSCKGADVEAAKVVRYVCEEKCRIIAHPGPDNDSCRQASGVDDETLPGMTHFARNRAIVDASDVIFATPYEMKKQPQGGTWYTIGYAQKKGKRVVVILPDGSVME